MRLREMCPVFLRKGRASLWWWCPTLLRCRCPALLRWWWSPAFLPRMVVEVGGRKGGGRGTAGEILKVIVLVVIRVALVLRRGIRRGGSDWRDLIIVKVFYDSLDHILCLLRRRWDKRGFRAWGMMGTGRLSGMLRGMGLRGMKWMVVEGRRRMRGRISDGRGV